MSTNGMYYVLDWGKTVREFGTLTDARAFADYVSAREHMAIKVVDHAGRTVYVTPAGSCKRGGLT